MSPWWTCRHLEWLHLSILISSVNFEFAMIARGPRFEPLSVCFSLPVTYSWNMKKIYIFLTSTEVVITEISRTCLNIFSKDLQQRSQNSSKLEKLFDKPSTFCYHSSCILNLFKNSLLQAAKFWLTCSRLHSIKLQAIHFLPFQQCF